MATTLFDPRIPTELRSQTASIPHISGVLKSVRAKSGCTSVHRSAYSLRPWREAISFAWFAYFAVERQLSEGPRGLRSYPTESLDND